MQPFHLSKIREVSSNQWNTLDGIEFPFSEHAFLDALEESSCVGFDSGWSPCHITLWDKRRLQGGLCLYEKNNSYGEYIFDWEWAKAYQNFGLNYYPKLVSAIPFTPATGRKLLVSSVENSRLVQEKLLDEALKTTRKRKCSSLHFLFINQDELSIFRKMGFLIRYSFQFHWKNNEYSHFDDFLSTLKRKRRKEILRERKLIKQQMIRVEILDGEEIGLDQIQSMYKFYISTTYKKWGQSYLTEAFFNNIHQTMRKRLLLILAYDEHGDCVAGSINFKKNKKLYGRYWGCKRNYKGLHFELCYYQPIEYAIRKGIILFEAGAQGDHKIKRGFLPEITYSAHWLENREFHDYISKFVEAERNAIRKGIENFSPHSPYKDKLTFLPESDRL